MDWQRGNAIKEEVVNDTPLNLKEIKYKIAHVVNLELKDFHLKKKNENNPFGKWGLK